MLACYNRARDRCEAALSGCCGTTDDQRVTAHGHARLRLVHVDYETAQSSEAKTSTSMPAVKL